MKKLLIIFFLIPILTFGQNYLKVNNLVFQNHKDTVHRLRVHVDTLFINNDTMFVQYTPGGGTITTLYQGTGMKNSANPIIFVGTIGVDTTKVIMFNDTLIGGKIGTKYENPWLWASGKIYERTITNKVGLGTTTPVYPLDLISLKDTTPFHIKSFSARTKPQLFFTNYWNGEIGRIKLDSSNVNMGGLSLVGNTTGVDNTAMGLYALNQNTTGSYNTAIGSSSLYANVDGGQNCGVGERALNFNVSGLNNNAIGASSLQFNTTGWNNNAMGFSALRDNVAALQNIGIGSYTLQLHKSGDNNVAVGHASLTADTSGYSNVSIGSQNLYSNKNGYNNTSVGFKAGYSATGHDNVFLGYQAGYNETGNSSLYIDNTNANKFNALIWGDFTNDSLRLNGVVGVKTIPSAATPTKSLVTDASNIVKYTTYVPAQDSTKNPWLFTSIGDVVLRDINDSVGIGNTHPLFKLDITGTTRSSSVNGYGLSGVSTNSIGVSGTTAGGQGVWGESSSSGYGVYGQSVSGTGVFGGSTSGLGVYGHSHTGFAGKFSGRLFGDTIRMSSKYSLKLSGNADSCVYFNRLDSTLKIKKIISVQEGDTTGEMLVWNNSTKVWQPTLWNHFSYNQSLNTIYLKNALQVYWIAPGDSPYLTNDNKDLYTNYGFNAYDLKLRSRRVGTADTLVTIEKDTLKTRIIHNIVTGTGTTGTLPKFTGTSTIGNSLISESGTKVTVNGDFVYTFIHCVASADSISPVYTPAVAQNVYTKINTTLLVAHDNDGMTVAGDSVRVLTAGDYRIDISVTIAGAANDQWRIKLFKNNAPMATSIGRFAITTTLASRYDTYDYFWYITASANDWYSFRITNLTNGDDPNISDYKIMFTKMPE